MKKRVHLIVAAVILLLVTPQLFAQYDRDTVVAVMRNNVKLLGAINSAVNSEDFYTAAVKLMELAEGHKTLEQMPPPRGSRAEWKRMQVELIDAAFRAIGACAERDAKAVQGEVSKIIALRNEGHGSFQ
jgi:hypothetical protein